MAEHKQNHTWPVPWQPEILVRERRSGWQAYFKISKHIFSVDDIRKTRDLAMEDHRRLIQAFKLLEEKKNELLTAMRKELIIASNLLKEAGLIDRLTEHSELIDAAGNFKKESAA